MTKISIKVLHLHWLVVFLLSSQLGATNYYVSVTGSDANPGTLVDPYLTIQKGLNVMSPGDTVFVRGGVYNEQLFWVNSGLVGQECVLMNYQNEIVEVDGTGLFDLNMMLIANVNHLIVDGLVFQNLYMQDANGIFVLGEGENIRISNCEIRNIGWINDPNADPNSVDPAGQAHGLLVNGRTTTGFKDITISDNKIHDIISGNSEALTLVGNVSNFELLRDTVYNTTNIAIDIAGHYSWAIDNGVHDTLNQSRNGLVKNCVVYENRRFSNLDAPPGIYTDGARNVILEANVSYNNGVGMSIGCENTNKNSDNIIAINNVVYNNDNEGIYFGSNAIGSEIKSCILKNNTFYENGVIGPWHSEVFLQNSDSCLIAENIMIALNSEHHCVGLFSPYLANNLNVDNNLVFRYNGDFSFLYVEGTPSQYTPTNSTIEDPKFNNNGLPFPDLGLLPGSPALNKGLNIYEQISPFDFYGNERLINGSLDLGAIENQNGGCPDTLTITTMDKLRGKYFAKSLIKLDLTDTDIINNMELHAPNLEVASGTQLKSLVVLQSEGCSN